MSIQFESWQDKVMTVEGLIPADELGITLPHEHFDVQGWDHKERNYFNSAYMELVKFKEAGGKTLVDMTNIGIDRDPKFIKKLAAKVGIQVIAGTGYFKDAWIPPEVREMTVEEMSQTMIQEIVYGMDGTDIHAGVIGEIGVSRSITSTEEKVLAAAARAQRYTGAAINVHFDIAVNPTVYNHALDILEDEGADLTRVALDHFVARPDALELCQQLAGRGCFVEFDMLGQESWPLLDDLIHTDPDVQISSIKGFIDNGMLDHILISQDVCHATLMTVNGGEGYVHILKNVVPKLKSYSVTDKQINQLLVENPKRYLAFRNYDN